MRLVVCQACSRHVRDTESSCPFCARDFEPLERSAGRERLSPAMALAVAAVSLGASHCDKDARVAVNREASASPSLSATPLPSAAPSVRAAHGTAAGGTAGTAPVPSANGGDETPAEAARLASIYGAPSPGYAVKQTGPRGNATIGPIVSEGSAPPDAERVVRGMRAGFRACYNLALSKTPSAATKLQGSVRLKIHVAAAGHVTDVNLVAENPDLLPVTSCMKGRIRAARFEAAGGPSIVTTDIAFTVSK